MGGKWNQQNKILPGAYINILGETPLSIKQLDRGIVALPLDLKWGTKGSYYKIHSGDNTLKTLGYDISDIISIREALKNAYEVIVYKLNGGTKATATLTSGVTATATLEGTRGNDISVITEAFNGKFKISTYLDSQLVDTQIVAAYSEFTSNGYIDIKGSGEIISGTKKLTSGSDDTSTITEYNTCLEFLKTQNFNVVAYGGDTTEVKAVIESYVKDSRENEGIKIQAVMRNYTCDYEGIIVVENGVVLEDGTEISTGDACYWIAGATAGANINQSNTGKVYEGAIDVNPRFTKTQMEEKIKSGKLIFKVDNNHRVTIVYDINTLLSYLPNKKESFKKNRVIRTLDGIANDITSVWEYNFMGKIDNNADGRSLYRGALVDYFKGLQSINAIENFSPEDVIVEPGTDSDAITVKVGVEITDSAEKLYMTVTV
ncbi:phage tail sheath family protein [Clostridium sp.]|uniref:phage tail sheath family protein n=1 Tax=Clostridium sp. TaxID=1506 RepID=UPI0032168D57